MKTRQPMEAAARVSFAPSPSFAPLDVPPGRAEQSEDQGTVGIIDSQLTVRFEKVDIHKVLKRFFESQHLNYTIKSDVESDKVTCSLQGVAMELALDMILKTVKQPLIYRVEGGVYVIIPKDK